MKRRFYTGLAMAMLVAMMLLGGCAQQPAEGSGQSGNDAGQSNSQSASVASAPAESDVPAAAAVLVFEYDGAAVAMGENMEEVLGRLGEPNDIFEAPSCAFEGVDKIFYYPGFLINTYPDAEEDFVLSLTLTDDSVKTPEGVYLGMSADDVTERYGECDELLENQMFYVRGTTELVFLLEGDEVVDITYYYTEV